MMQSIAIILICIVKLYDCSSSSVAVIVDDDHVEWSMRVAASMPSPIVNDNNLMRATNDWQPTVNQRNAIHQHIVIFDANNNGDDKQMLDKSSQSNKHDNVITVMNQSKNNVNDSGNRFQQQRTNDGVDDDDDDDDDDNDDKHNYFNETKRRMSRIKRQTDQRQDICDTQCVCRNDENFLTVECNFKQHYALSPSQYFVHPSATSILIKLSSDAEFLLEGHMFATNNLNRITIEGTGSRSGREIVEIHSNAFYGNGGPFPEIDILNVHSVMIHNGSFFGEFKLNIINCTKVWIYGDAFATSTFHGHFERIHDLVIFERAFTKSTGKIFITNCRIDELQRLDAALKEIKFSDSTVEIIKKGAFDVLAINSIVFENCIIGTIERRALTEKLFSNNFALIGCTIGTIETEAIMGSGITDVIVQQNNINFIKQRAILVNAVSTFIENNTINYVERFWFSINEWSNVTIENNHFGDYQQMAVEYTKNPLVCLFSNNYITKTSRGSLNFKDPRCRIRQISFSQLCSCDTRYFRNIAYNDLRTELFCRIDETLAHCFNATLFNVQAYEREICDDKAEGIDCLKNRANTKPNGFFVDLNLFKHKEKILYIYLAVGALLIIVGIILFICLIRHCARRHRKHIDDGPIRDIMLTENIQQNGMTSTFKPLATINRRDPSFSHSDLLIIQKTLQLMKQKYPPEIYDQVHNNTTKLVGGNLTESDKVLTIGEIIRNLVECENAGTDFVAFTDILYNHLDSTDNHVGQSVVAVAPPIDPIYFEPNVQHVDETEPFHPTENGYALPGPTTAAPPGEHIYAEPIHLQQPLLRNEYTVPIDRNDSVSNLYTEPIARAIEDDRWSSLPRPQNAIIKPAIAGTSITANEQNLMHLYAQPSTSRQFHSNAPPLLTSFSLSTGNVGVTSNAPKISQLEGERFKNSVHSSSQESNNSHSDHSGGSGDTLPLDDDDNNDDDPIDYADA